MSDQLTIKIPELYMRLLQLICDEQGQDPQKYLEGLIRWGLWHEGLKLQQTQAHNKAYKDELRARAAGLAEIYRRDISVAELEQAERARIKKIRKQAGPEYSGPIGSLPGEILIQAEKAQQQEGHR